MTREELERRLAALTVPAASRVIDVHPDSAVLVVQCPACGVHALLLCPKCDPHDPAEAYDHCDDIGDLAAALGMGQVL